MPLAISSIVSRASDADLVEADTGDEVVMLRMDDGTCFGLNRVGAAIWRQLGEERSVGQIFDALASTFNVDRDTCERQVLALLEELTAERLVVVRAA